MWRLIQARYIIYRRTLWHFKSMFGSSLSASSAYQWFTKKQDQLWLSASIQPHILNSRTKPTYINTRNCFFLDFLTGVAHSWALADSNCILKVMPITYFLVVLPSLYNHDVWPAGYLKICSFDCERSRTSGQKYLAVMNYIYFYYFSFFTSPDSLFKKHSR